MHYYIDIVAHTTAFDTPVVGHWLGKSSAQQYTLNLSQLCGNQGQMPQGKGQGKAYLFSFVWNLRNDYIMRLFV